ncbi:DUF4436 family protein [Actinocrispum wychmicini]|uniref:Uncharacterized protein DUF4436 n=1 Tax=Actinocrispum wychmicini TaxID=1213861 RepID=A0A4R2J9L0_9PSEU|nr:DUF4436 family protein [Actinocrispum wychmicini]TCO56021.1 uncharacterized protein DUF4436 [Actinocrispum wychmicini]
MNSRTTTGRGPARVVKAAIIAVAVVLVTAGGLWMYLGERSAGQTATTLGDTQNPDRVDIEVWVQKVDAATQELAAQVFVHPMGRLADESGFPKHDFTVSALATKGDTLSFKAGKTVSAADIKVPLGEGTVTDYPFDRYKVTFGFDATQGAQPLPVSVTLANIDSFFKIKPSEAAGDGNVVTFTATANRSTGTTLFAVFVMVLMWGLSVAAVLAAWFTTHGRRGLLWPAVGLMATLLFALVPLRNAVPGAPPIGSVIDFCAFFIVECVIAISLISTVLFGYRVEGRKEEETKEPPAPEPQPTPQLAPPGPQPVQHGFPPHSPPHGLPAPIGQPMQATGQYPQNWPQRVDPSWAAGPSTTERLPPR